MFEFKFQDSFEPSKNSLRAWLYVKKNELPSYGVIRPGLFNQSDSSLLTIGFFTILLLEGAATVWVKALGITIETILSFIILDLFLAIFGHISYGNIIKYKNYILVNNNSAETDIKIGSDIIKSTTLLTRKISNWTYYRTFFNLLIIISGFLKFFWFYDDYKNIDSTAMLIAFFYFAGAILHILCTGFFISHYYCYINLKEEYSKYLSSSNNKYSFNPKNPRILKIISSFPLVECESWHHSLLKIDDKNYELVTNGIITDEQLSELIGKQHTPEQKRLIAIKGVEQQLNLML